MLNENSSAPIDFPLNISVASQIFSNPPPAHPAITPCSTYNLPLCTLSFNVNLTLLLSRLTNAFFSTSSNITKRFAFNYSIV